MKKPITKPKRRFSAKLIKKNGNGVVATSGKKGATAEKSGTASARTNKTIVANRNRKDSAALKQIETKNRQLTHELQQKNRALEIEAALERVRIRTMAMHNSDELRDVVAVLYAQMTSLGLAPRGCELILCDEETELLQYWSVAPGAELPDCYTIPRKSHPFFQKSWQAWKKRTPRLVVTLRGLEKKKFDKHIFEKTAFKTFPERAKKIIKAEKVDVFSMVTMKYGLLEAADTIPLPEDKFPILERFAQVFEQTYTRFLDLQKAEAQAKEAEIQLGLERVRAASMAMHESKELTKIVALVYEQLSSLGFDAWSYLIRTREDIREGFTTWLSLKEMSVLPEGYHLPKLNHPIHKKVMKAWDDQLEYHVIGFEGKEKKQYDNLLFTKTEWKKFPKKVKDAFRSMNRAVVCSSNYKHIGLQAVGTEPLPEEQAKILIRFAKAFEQTYTRFLDLQKAEAQAKEAEIELALERVRAKTMAMQKSEELRELVFEYYKQIHPFGFAKWGFEIKIAKEDKSGFYCWISPPGARIQPEGFNIPTLDHWVLKKYWSVYEQQIPITSIVNSGADKRKLAVLLLEKSDMKNLPEDVKANIMETEYVNFSVAAMRFGLLKAVDMEPVPEKDASILQRFAKVFEQTYTRFLDLQKAEAQAREAQIEVALERVRSRSMAMHKSTELTETAMLVYKELSALGVPPFMTGFVLVDEAKGIQEVWFSAPEGEHMDRFFLPLTGDPILDERYRNWKNKEPIYHEMVEGERLITHLEYVSTFFGTQEAEQQALNFPDSIVFYCGYFPEGYLHILSKTILGAGQESIMKRFTQTFAMTYRRFLDLQKAEAQAREAQIEIALERIRARALAMHSSEELLDVARVLREQMGLLGQQQLHGCVVELYETNPDDIESWHAFRPEGTKEDKLIEGKVYFAKDSCAVIREMIERYRGPENEYTIEASGDKLDKWHAVLAAVVPEVRTYWSSMESMPATMYFHCADFSGGTLLTASADPIANEVKGLQARAANVFDLAYRRFLDLKKAEAQAREAMIEAALERIRSRTMAMHKSDELSEVASLLFQQIGELGIKVWTAGFNVWLNNDNAYQDWITSPKGGFIEPYIVDTTQFPVFIEVREAKQRGDDFFVQYVGGEMIKAMYGELSKFAPQQFEIMLQDGFEFPKHQYDHFVFGSTVSLMFITFEPLPEAHDIFKRFGKVFEQTYTRFLDLQKAEAQAREAQIEAALERVRASAMAMHKSDDLRHVVAVVFKELELSLNIQICILLIFNAEATEIEWWSTGMVTDVLLPQSYKVPLADMIKDNKLVQRYLGALQHGLAYDVFELSGETKRSWDRYLFEHTELKQMPKETQEAMMSFECVFLADAFMSHGTLEIAGPEPLPEDKGLILQRFAKVIDLTYRRVEDLQKAEAQAREAQIEAALERVRSRSMAMQKSTELNIILATMFTELSSLGVEMARNVIWIYNPEDRSVRWWAANPEAESGAESYLITYQDHPVYHEYWKAWEERRTKYLYILEGENMVSWGDALFYRTELGKLPQEVQMAMRAPNRVYLYNTFNDFGVLFIVCLEPLPDEKFSIIERFGKVFDQSYTRFTDILKAEAQAREAQIEAALERVRSRSMAMHKSDELLDVVNTVFERLRDLNLPIDAAAIFVFEKGGYDYWFATSDSKYPTGMHLPTRGNQVVDDISNAREAHVDFFSKLYSFDDKNHFFHNIFENTDFRHIPDERKKFLLECESLSLSVALEKNSGIQLNSYIGKILSPKEVDILKRFTRVFEQAYTRFLDLQRAEAQAREAQIEAALERVRSRSMAMQQSTELNIVLATMFTELSSLGVEMARNVIWIYSPEDRSVRWWAANPEAESGAESYLITYQDHPVYHEYWKAWEERRTKYLYILEGENMVSWCDALFYKTELGKLPQEVQMAMRAPGRVYLYNTFNDFGVLFIVCLEPLPDEKFSIIEKFGKVFDQSYTRFTDIQKAEAREMEAIRQASLDRVRAEIASMRTAKDLERITPLIWKELNTLSVPFIRCGVFIMDEDLQIIHNFLSTPDGKAIASFELPYDTPGFVANILKHWREKIILLDHWDENGMKNFAQVLVNQGIFNEPGQYLKTLPKEGLYLHMLPFLQGMLYVGNTSQLAPENLDLLLSLAEAFSTAYARYEDFNKLEAAKAQVDNTLVELKQTQAQLVQSEKMASLGQLTAGIAHEIQNPLNFVNNFSEVNEELLAEMKDELRNGKIDDALALADNVLENQKKINHHGKRADGIVKGMLQHSRSSSGVKESTDINVLADEYLRLAYHGFRAKDKSFNAKFTTDFDPTIEAINVMPQEIGRVILNLINNAFYAVNEKSKQNIAGYEPIIWVSTRRADSPLGAGGSGGKTEIKVKDNGSGIQDSIKEKIFQPFFTTKPTGQGTGLGLSLSYDIVKAHGGELKVDTREGKGSEFVIQLPVV